MLELHAMKAIGFIREIEGDRLHSKYLDDKRNLNKSPVHESEKEQIINYLNNSETVIGFTLALYDGDNYEKYIGSHKYLSDGEWIWAGYFPYYLNEAKFSELDTEFLQHLRAKNFKVTPLSLQQRKEIIAFIEKDMFYTKR